MWKCNECVVRRVVRCMHASGRRRFPRRTTRSSLSVRGSLAHSSLLDSMTFLDISFWRRMKLWRR